jgi:hypothetical protein
MEEPVSGADAYSEWQERLKRFESSDLSIDLFCQQEDVGQSTFLDWLRVLKREQFRPPSEARSAAKGPAFVPVTVRTSSIEILLPGGGLVRLSAGVDRAVLLDVIRIISALPQESPS